METKQHNGKVAHSQSKPKINLADLTLHLVGKRILVRFNDGKSIAGVLETIGTFQIAVKCNDATLYIQKSNTRYIRIAKDNE